MWELKLTNWAFNTLSIIIAGLIVGIVWDVVKAMRLDRKSFLNDKSLRQRIREYNLRWRDKYE